MTCNIFICTILIGLLESPKRSSLKANLGQSRENLLFLHFSVTLNLNISIIKLLSKVILDDSNKPNRIVQMNVLHATYSDIVIYKYLVSK